MYLRTHYFFATYNLGWVGYESIRELGLQELDPVLLTFRGSSKFVKDSDVIAKQFVKDLL